MMANVTIFDMTNETLSLKTLVRSNINLYHRKCDRQHRIKNIVQMIERYSICTCCWNVSTYEWDIYKGKICNRLSYRKVSFSIGPDCQFSGVGQGIMQPGSTRSILYFTFNEIYSIMLLTNSIYPHGKLDMPGELVKFIHGISSDI